MITGYKFARIRERKYNYEVIRCVVRVTAADIFIGQCEQGAKVCIKVSSSDKRDNILITKQTQVVLLYGERQRMILAR